MLQNNPLMSVASLLRTRLATWEAGYVARARAANPGLYQDTYTPAPRPVPPTVGVPTPVAPTPTPPPVPTPTPPVVPTPTPPVVGSPLPPSLVPTGAAPNQNASPNQRKVFVDYMPWFNTPKDNHWSWGGHNPAQIGANGLPNTATADHPLIGPYSSLDDATLGYQLLLMKAAGFDGAILTWYGQGSYEDQATKALFAKTQSWASQFGLNFSLSLMDDAGEYQKYGAAQRTQAVANNVRYVQDTYANSPVYQKLNGKPLYYVFPKPDGGSTTVTPAQWQAAKAATGNAFDLSVENASAGYNGVSDVPYAWVQLGKNPSDDNQAYLNWYDKNYGKQVQSGQVPVAEGVVYDGFNDSGVGGWTGNPANTRLMNRKTPTGKDVLQDTWDNLNAYNAANPNAPINWVQMTTWNDWNEGTEIEPSYERGYKPLETAAANNYAFKGQAAPQDMADAENFANRYLQLRHAGKTDADLAAGLRAFFQGNYALALQSLPAG